MKIKKFVFAFAILAIATVCTLNVQSSLNKAGEFGYSSLADLIELNSASAEVENPWDCVGGQCPLYGGPGELGTYWDGNYYICCGAIWLEQFPGQDEF